MAKKDERVTKRKVTMTSVVALDNGNIQKVQYVDFVRPDVLEAYLADARSRHQNVEVSDEPDAGPAGYHGKTYIPETLAHPLAGQTFAATKED